MISVIIPALNEEEHIAACIDAVKISDDVGEVIVADGGSSERTVEIAEKYPGVKVIKTGRGRGLQLNAGGLAATGEILLFLHADTVLEKGWSTAVIRALKDHSVAAGAFTFAIDNRERKYRVVEKWVHLRSSLFKLPYGDQGLFIRRSVFGTLGGYQNIPLMEDIDLIERIKRTGTIVILDTKAYTSERRWRERGLLRTAVLNQFIMLLYWLGVSPQRLARIYYR